MTLGEFLFFRIFGPAIFGFVILWIVHWITGAIANIATKGDEDDLFVWKAEYLYVFFVMKDVMFAWAVGVVLFMLAGLF